MFRALRGRQALLVHAAFDRRPHGSSSLCCAASRVAARLLLAARSAAVHQRAAHRSAAASAPRAARPRACSSAAGDVGGAALTLAGPSLAATETLAELLAGEARAGDVICLHGPVGAGKSAFSRAYIRAVAGDTSLTVPSPTYLLQLTYEEHAGPPVHHYDLYRLSGPEDLRGLDLGASFSAAATLIEWADRLGASAAPPERLELRISDDAAAAAAAAAASRGEVEETDGGAPRVFTLTPHGPRWRELVAALAAHVRQPLVTDADAEPLGGLRVVGGTARHP